MSSNYEKINCPGLAEYWISLLAGKRQRLPIRSDQFFNALTLGANRTCKTETILALVLYLVHRIVSRTNQFLGGGAILRIQRNPDTCADSNLVTSNLNRLCDALDHARGNSICNN